MKSPYDPSLNIAILHIVFVGAGEYLGMNLKAERLSSLEVDHTADRCRRLDIFVER